MKNNSYAILNERLNDTFLSYVTPPDRSPLSEWSERHIYIGGASGPDIGPYRTDRAPYQKEVLDVCGDPAHRKVVIMFASQTGKTLMTGNVAAYHMVADPCPILAVLPSNSAAKRWNYSKLSPTINASPILQSTITEDTILKKIFPGGYLVMVGAMSAAAFRMLSVRLLILDEVDAYPFAVAEEGDPVSLARGRTTAFWNSKEIMISTPTMETTSRISAEFQLSDQRHFYVPCPECEQYQVLYWDRIGISNDDAGTAHFRCVFTQENIDDEEFIAKRSLVDSPKVCGKTSSEAKKMWMLRNGKWVAHNPDSKTPGFWLPATYSPWFGWDQLAEEWLSVRTPEQRKTFINQRLAEPYEEKTDKVDLGDIEQRLEDYESPCPPGVGAVIGTIDVQHDRVEVLITGYGADEEKWIMDHQVIDGAVHQDVVWDSLLEFIQNASYANKNGAEVLVQAWGIDTGAWTQHVYPFVRKCQLLGIPMYGIKGSSKYTAPPTPSKPTYNKEHKVRIYEIGVNEIKHSLIPALLIEPPGPASLHLPKGVTDEFLKQLTSEHLHKSTTRTGNVQAIWKKHYTRNEILDCYVYSYAVYLLHFKNKRIDVGDKVELIEKAEPLRKKEDKTPDTNSIPLPKRPIPNKKTPKTSVFGRGSWYGGFKS